MSKSKSHTFHFVPKGSPHLHTIAGSVEPSENTIVEYNWSCSAAKKLLEFHKIFWLMLTNKWPVYYFHFVPYFWLLPILLVLRRRVVLHLWGGEFYAALLTPNYLEARAIKKDSLLKNNFAEPMLPTRGLKSRLRSLCFLLVMGRANAIVCAKYKYRILSRAYYKTFKGVLAAENLEIMRYGVDTIEKKETAAVARENGSTLKVLVFHSATPDIKLDHTALYLEKLSKKFDLHLVGFLSYSGQNEDSRNKIESRYRTLLSPFCSSFTIYREFLSLEDLDLVLNDIDVSLISAYRDEGVGLLTRLIMRGGLVCSNRRSVNYMYFKEMCPNKACTPGFLLRASDEQLTKARAEPPQLRYSTTKYHERMIGT